MLKKFLVTIKIYTVGNNPVDIEGITYREIVKQYKEALEGMHRTKGNIHLDVLKVEENET